MNEHLFYSKLVFNEMGGSAHELTRYNINESRLNKYLLDFYPSYANLG
jgi:high-affinity Fe2+/Pb2+ permease